MNRAILLDIEGTTTPIDFVHQTLFPYARARISGFVSENSARLKTEITQLVAEHRDDIEYSNGLNPDSANSVADYLKFLIETDRKSTPLKSIQGMIWQTGYENGDLVSPVYPDVAEAFERWKSDGNMIAIYSSGSVLAQNLIFKYSDQGDLTRFIDRYFDTQVGHKRETESYQRISAELGLDAGSILFISDISEELDAASAAGFETALSLRAGNAVVEGQKRYRAISTFDELE